jgi:putative sterol carrier protein
MSSVIETALAALKEKLPGGFDHVVKFVLTGDGSIMIDRNGVRAGDEDAEATLTADADVFKSILDGELSPMSAFMTGKLAVGGSTGVAMKLGSALA